MDLMNYTSTFANLAEEALKCLRIAENELNELITTTTTVCPTTWDGILCWPPSAGASLAHHSCFSELHGIKYDTSQNATRWCYANGTWATYSNYTSCLDLKKEETSSFEPSVELTTMIYSFGYSVSLIALLLAIWIFIYYKDLRCLRNTIHTNLMLTYILADSMWILNFTLQSTVQSDSVSCVLLVVLLHYFHLTNFFWMFVEGLYLYMLVVETFTRENIKLRAYLVIGWGTPLAVVIAWAVTRALFDDSPAELQLPEPFQKSCPWMLPHYIDWMYQTPAVLVLVANLIFLVMIMWVLITKLRSANNVETQQYRKATKALLVLIPLLGITYILFIVGPSEGSYGDVYSYIRAFLLSTQGLMVALFYCFLNSEVQNTFRHHFSRWQEARAIRLHRYSCRKDWSPNTRAESIRLCSKSEGTPRFYKKRESNVSEATTLTLVGYPGAKRVSNGSMTAVTTTVKSVCFPGGQVEENML